MHGAAGYSRSADRKSAGGERMERTVSNVEEHSPTTAATETRAAEQESVTSLNQAPALALSGPEGRALRQPRGHSTSVNSLTHQKMTGRSRQPSRCWPPAPARGQARRDAGPLTARAQRNAGASGTGTPADICVGGANGPAGRAWCWCIAGLEIPSLARARASSPQPPVAVPGCVRADGAAGMAGAPRGDMGCIVGDGGTGTIGGDGTIELAPIGGSSGGDGARSGSCGGAPCSP